MYSPRSISSTRWTKSTGLTCGLQGRPGFARSGIDNAAHVGGLIAGAALAWVLVELLDETAGAAQRRRQQVLGLGLVAVMVGGLTWTAQPGIDHRQLFQSQSAMQDLLPRLRAAEDAFQADATAHREGRLSEAQLVDAMEQRHIPAYRDIVQAIKTLAPDASMSRLRDIGELYAALLEVMTLEVRKYRGTADPSQVDARQAVLSKQLQEISERLKSTAP